MDATTKQAILSALRSILIALGAWGTGKGLIDDDTVNSIVGSLMVIIPLVWGVIEKYRTKDAVPVTVWVKVDKPPEVVKEEV
jgi:hypothetical protein